MQAFAVQDMMPDQRRDGLERGGAGANLVGQGRQAQTDVLAGLGYVDRGLRSGGPFIRLQDGNVRIRNLHLYWPDDTGCRH